MGLIPDAYAQSAQVTAPAAGLDPSFFSTHAASVLVIVGVVVVVVSLLLVVANKSVTTGHSIILGAGLAFLAMPFVTNFEWSDKGFKLTMKSAAESLTEEVAKLTKDNEAIRQQLKEAVAGTVARVEEVDPTAAGAPPGRPSVDEGKNDWEKLTKPEFFQDFSVKNRAAIEMNRNSLGKLQDIQKSLKASDF